MLRTDATRGVRRAPLTYAVWAFVFLGGLAFMYVSADLTMVELTGLEPIDALAGFAVPVLGASYLGMIAALAWAEGRPKPASGVVSA